MRRSSTSLPAFRLASTSCVGHPREGGLLRRGEGGATADGEVEQER